MVEIIIKGEPEEVYRTIQILAQQDHSDSSQEGEKEGSQTEDEGVEKPPLSKDEVLQLLSMITPGALKIIREMAKHPTLYSFDDLQKAVGLSGTAVAGRLSSIGHKKNKLFPGKADPIIRDYSQQVYRMLPEIAEAVRDFRQNQS